MEFFDVLLKIGYGLIIFFAGRVWEHMVWQKKTGCNGYRQAQVQLGRPKR